MYDPLYSEKIGLGGFRCRDCGAVTKTEKGIREHCWRKHGEKIQSELSFTIEPIPGAAGSAEGSAESAAARANLSEVRHDSCSKKREGEG